MNWLYGTASLMALSLLLGNVSAAIPEPYSVFYGELRIDDVLVTQDDDVLVIARVVGVPEPVGTYRFGAAPAGDCDSNGIPDPCDLGCGAAGFNCASFGACGTAVDVNPVDGLPDICPGNRYVLKIRMESLADASPQSPDTATIGQTALIYVQVGSEAEKLATTVSLAARGIIQNLTLTLGAAVPVAADPTGIAKSRFVSFVPGDSGGETALRVKLTSLHHVNPPYTGGPSVPFTSLEGQTRWVGPPVQYVESNSGGPMFFASHLQCTPHYQDWSTIGLLHVTGSAIVPSSVYEVENVAASCMGIEASCTAVSAPLAIATARWSDVETPFNPPSSTVQPDLGDVSALVNKFRNAPGAPIKARALLVGGDTFGAIDIVTEFSFIHISACVDAFRGRPYPHTIAACP